MVFVVSDIINGTKWKANNGGPFYWALVSEPGCLRFSQLVVEDLPILFYILRPRIIDFPRLGGLI